MAVSSGPSATAPTMRAFSKSWDALVSQERSSSLRVSSIELAAIAQHVVGQASLHFTDTVDLAPSPDEHIGGYKQPSQATLGALVASNGTFVALRHDNH